MKASATRFTGLVAAAAALLLGANNGLAHCDTMDGPVVLQAKTALEQKDVTPVLKWIKPENEAELKSAFAKTLAVRTGTKAARELADQFFFETLVRLHRQGEGAAYTGLKPGGSAVEPVIAASDKALEAGQMAGLTKTMAEESAKGIQTRFARALETKRHAEHNVDAGREYVAAYVEFVHYVEALHATATRPTAAHGHSEHAATKAATPAHDHQH